MLIYSVLMALPLLILGVKLKYAESLRYDKDHIELRKYGFLVWRLK